MFDFEKLEVYKKAQQFNKEVYSFLRNSKTILTKEDFKQFYGKVEELFRMVFRVSSCAELRLGMRV